MLKYGWFVGLFVFVLAFLGYWLTAQLFGGTGSDDFGYFDRLAHSFLNGELAIRTRIRGDLAFYGGRWYVPFPPLPAILLLPWVAIQQTEQVDTILFSIIVGACNALLTYLVLEAASKRGFSRLSRGDNVWITVLFAFGTVHWMMAVQGTVWFMAQLTAYTFVALSILFAMREKHLLIVGTALAIAMLARPHVSLMVIFLLAIAFAHFRPTLRELVRQMVFLATPLLIATGALLAYNQARFENWRDFGYKSQYVAPELEDDLDEYGQFNVHFLPRNLRALLWATPQIDDELGGLWPDKWGMSIFLTTPVFLYLFRPQLRRDNFGLLLGAWTAIGLILVPLLLYYNTGWWQFGYRFALDFMLPLLLVLVFTARKDRLSWLFKGLVVVSILINLWGTIWFAVITGRFSPL